MIGLEDTNAIYRSDIITVEIYINKIRVCIFALVIDEDLENPFKNNFIINVKHKLIEINKNTEKIKKI